MKNLAELFKPHVDKDGIVVENPWEGGDGACEHFGALILLRWMNSPVFVNGVDLTVAYYSAVKKLINKPSGLWRRHCNHSPVGIKNYWAAEWNRGTRDNGTTALIASIVFEDSETFMAMYKGFIRRWWFCGNTFPRNIWNNDLDHAKFGAPWRQPMDPTPTLPDYGGMLKAIAYRSRLVNKNTWFWDILCCLIPAILIRRDIGKGDNDGNHLNAFIRIHFCVRRKPTWISRLALLILPKNIELEKEFGDGSASARRNPPMHILADMYLQQCSWDI